MGEHQLGVEVRSDTGKGVARKLRAAGRIPGICYKGDASSRPIQLDPHELDRLIHRSSAGLNTLIDLKGGGELDGTVVLVKDLQRDPVKGTLLHADLYAIDVNKTIEVSVPIHLRGTPKGVQLDGGILEHTLREIELQCLPNAIPEEILLDVSDVALGDSVHVRDLALPGGVELMTDPDLSVLSVAAPKVEEEPVAEVEGEEADAEAAAAAAGAEGAPDADASESGGDEAKRDGD